MSGRVLAAAVVLLAVASGCGSGGSGPGKAQREVLRALDATERVSRAYTYEERTASEVVRVRGEVQDSLRYTGTVLAGDAEVSSVIVSDDALAVRYADPSRIPNLQSLRASDDAAAGALASGKWVVDYTAAPPLTAAVTREGSLEVGRDPVLDAAYVVQYVRRAIIDALLVVEFNPDDLQYNPNDDPFRAEVPSRGSGVVRYDLSPPPLPRRTQRGTVGALPSTPMFRKMALFVRDGRVVRVLEDIDVERQKDFRRAAETGRPKYFLQLLGAVREGRTREPVRERRMRYDVTGFGRTLTVQVPLDAFAGDLGAIVGTTRGVIGGRGGRAASPPPGG